jgi:hypothetical protein
MTSSINIPVLIVPCFCVSKALETALNFIKPLFENNFAYRNNVKYNNQGYHLCGLVVSAPDYRSKGLGSIAGATIFPLKQWVWNGVHSAS